MMALSTEWATWCSAHTQMQDISVRLNPATEQVHISISRKMIQSRNNGTILTIATIIKFVMALAAKAELAALFIITRKMVPHRQTLIDMGWPQPWSPIQTDNLTAVGVTNKTIFPKRVKMMDMRLWWLQYHGSQKQFCYYWDAGSKNWADYSTKHHPDIDHEAHCPTHAGIWNIPLVLPQWVLPFLFFSSHFISFYSITASRDDHCKGV